MYFETECFNVVNELSGGMNPIFEIASFENGKVKKEKLCAFMDSDRKVKMSNFAN